MVYSPLLLKIFQRFRLSDLGLYLNFLHGKIRLLLASLHVCIFLDQASRFLFHHLQELIALPGAPIQSHPDSPSSWFGAYIDCFSIKC